MGFLDQMFQNPDTASALGLLGTGLMAGNAPQGFQQAIGLLDAGPERRMKQKLLEAQVAETMAQADERKQKVAQAQADAARMQQIPGLFRQPGMAGGQPVPQTFGGTDVPMFSAPMGAAPMQQTPGGFDVQAAVKLGLPPELISKYAALQDIGRQKVARTVKGMGPDGKEYEYQVDEFGKKVGDPFAQYRAPISVNQGDKTTFADPYSLKPVGAFQTFQSPDSKASNAVAIRGQNMTDARSREANGAGKVPAGYEPDPQEPGALKFIKGGPADPNAAKRAAPTEFQGKSATYGARAMEADKILSSLDGQYSPSAVNTKEALGRVPGLGGVLEGLGNAALSDSGQKAEQAQRNFVNAVLRQESGAAISQPEFENAKKQYFPQPFDSAAVKAQKAANRQTAIQGFLSNAKPGAVPSLTGGASGGWGIKEIK